MASTHPPIRNEIWRRSWGSVIGAVTVMFVLTIWFPFLVPNSLEDTDLYNVLIAGQELIKGNKIYSTHFNEQLLMKWGPAYRNQAVNVVAYPLPAVILFIPLSIVAIVAGFATYYIAIGATLAATIFISRTTLPLLVGIIAVLIYSPFHDLIRTANPSLLWFLINGVVLNRIVQSSVLRGLIVSISPLKPTEGLVCSSYGILAGNNRARCLLTAVFSLALLLAISFLLDSRWMSGWYNSLDLYLSKTPRISLILLLPVPLLVMALERRISLAALVAVQVCLFPANALYRYAPLYWGLLTFSRPQMFACIALSLGVYLMPGGIFSLPGQAGFVLCPYLLCLVLQTICRRLTSWPSARGS